MATKARLHWFWRAAIATAFGATCTAGYTRLNEYVNLMGWRGAPTMGWSFRVTDFFWYCAWGLAPSLGALLAYGLLTCWFGGSPADNELHCRRCNHILRGLSEPRCPECGEAI